MGTQWGADNAEELRGRELKDVLAGDRCLLPQHNKS
jgi:hypothetical protein